MGTAKLDRNTRRILKPVIEKQRRDRINKRLEELRALLLSTTKDSRLRNPKLEKAEILELTVEFIRKKADDIHTHLTLRDSIGSSPSTGQSGSKGVQSEGTSISTPTAISISTADLPDAAISSSSTTTSSSISISSSKAHSQATPSHQTSQESRGPGVQTDSCTRGPGVQTDSSPRASGMSQSCSPPVLPDSRLGPSAGGNVFAFPSNHSTLYASPFSLHPFAAFAPPPLPLPHISPSPLHPFPSPPYSLSPPSSPTYSSSSSPPLFSSSSPPPLFSFSSSSPPPLFSSSSSPPYLSIPSSCRFVFPASFSPGMSDLSSSSSSSSSSPATSPGFAMVTPPNPAPLAPVSLTTTPAQFRCTLERGQQPRRTLFTNSSSAATAAATSPAVSQQPARPSINAVWRPW